MVVKEKQSFNLWDTNGRRKDILNAINIYLRILCDIKDNYPNEEWDSYPKSLSQFLFYQKAVEASKEVFTKHDKYDIFLKSLGDADKQFLSKDKNWMEGVQYQEQLADTLDKDIEQRARHYTNNLVKIGFVDEARNITNSGWSFLKGDIRRDSIEELIPIDDTNLVLFRQLIKLKIFSKDVIDGKRKFCSPVLMAIYILLNTESIDKDDFVALVQGLNPFYSEQTFSIIQSDKWNIDDMIHSLSNSEEEIPEPFSHDECIDFATFTQYIKNRKSTANSATIYYSFYTALFNFRNNRSEENYNVLCNCLQKHKEMLKKAFGYGKQVFNIGRGNRYTLEEFLTKNQGHILLTTEHFNAELYKIYINSKFIDSSREYSDTTIRLLGATGLFKFKPMPELEYKDVLRVIFSNTFLSNSILGEMTEEEYKHYETEKNGFFRNNYTLEEILGLSNDQVIEIIQNLCTRYGVNNKQNLKEKLASERYEDFEQYINEVYPKDRIISLLSLFSDRSNDKIIQHEVNEAATVPTIYEYIVAIAWYYISDKNFNIYKSLNLTLNADFEPVVHASGGAGDIVIEYSEGIVMLEVTLMNKQAQKRGEWEPVLRHSLNLKAENKDKETVTFFVADELDYNTINIWRAVAAVPLESTTSHNEVDGVVIMPFTNQELICFLDNNIRSDTIIRETKKSFAGIPKLTDAQWRERIMQKLN